MLKSDLRSDFMSELRHEKQRYLLPRNDILNASITLKPEV